MGCGTLIGAGLSAAGAGASAVAAGDESNAMNQKTQAELLRQQQYRQKEQGIAQQSFAQSTPQAAAQQIAQGQNQYLGNIKQAEAAPLALAGPSLGDSREQQQRANMAAQQDSNFRGYGNYGFQQGLKDLSTNTQLNLLNNQAGQSEAVLPLELQAASQSQQGLSDIGKMLGSAGQIIGVANSIGGAGNLAGPTAMSQIGQYPMSAAMLNNIGMQAMPSSWASNPSLFNMYGFQ